MKVDIDPDDTKTVKTDPRGRACLGMEYADSNVEIVIMDSSDGENNE